MLRGAQPEASRAAREGGREGAQGGLLAGITALAPQPRALGFDDGIIIPPDEFPPARPRRSSAPRRPSAPLCAAPSASSSSWSTSPTSRWQPTAAHFEDLFFSTGVLPHGSVKEYYNEVTDGLVDITGDVVGPVPDAADARLVRQRQLRHRPADAATPTARNIMAHDAAVAADPTVNFAPYDNDGNGFVDAFIVVHAGSGGEETGNSRRHLVAQVDAAVSVYNADGTQDLRLPDHPRGRQDRRLRARAGPPALRLPRPLRHRLHVGGRRQLVPDGRRLVERRRRRPRAPVGLVQGEPGLGVGRPT